MVRPAKNMVIGLQRDSHTQHSIESDVDAGSEAEDQLFKKSTQRSRKLARKANKAVIQNTAPFTAAGIQVPRTEDDARLLVVKILEKHHLLIMVK